MRLPHSTTFESMTDMIAAIDGDPALADLAECWRLRELGLRADSLAACRRFVRQLDTVATEARRNLAGWLFACRDDNPHLRALLPQPLEDACREIFREWTEESPDSPIPHRWLGDLRSLQRALQLDPNDPRAATKLLVIHLEGMEYATHEMGCMGYITDDGESAADDAWRIKEAAKLLDSLDAHPEHSNWTRRLAQVARLHEIAVEYERLGAGVPYAHWLTRNHPDLAD